MSVLLSPPLEKLVQQKVDSGIYHSVNEVIREALQLLDERDYLLKRRFEALRVDIATGLEQANRGELIEAKAVFEQLRQKTANIKESS